MARRGGIATGLGLVAGIGALAAGGLAMGLELERRIVNKRIQRSSQDDVEAFFGLHVPGQKVTTPDGVVLHVEVDDAPSDLTLVFVHGYALDMDCWYFQRQHYRGRLRSVFYDERSHGRSTRSEAKRCRLPQLAEDLAQILDEVAGPGPVVLIGHSMGGMMIMRLAQSRPELFGSRIVGVALLHTSAGEMAEHSPIRGLPGRTFARVAEPMMAALNRIPDLVEHSRRAGSDLGYVVTRRMAFATDVPASYVEFVSEMLAKTPLEVVADFYPAFGDLDEYEVLATIGSLPVLVIGGEDDRWTPIEHTERIMELLPDAVALQVESCGHLGMIEHHHVFNERLDELIDRVRARLG
jgi:pimeloyl-ACP methyl ester carboxylesterase